MRIEIETELFFISLVIIVIAACIFFSRIAVSRKIRNDFLECLMPVLTPIEILVFNELKEGRDNKKIAAFTGIGSPSKVDIHIESILQKARCESVLKFVALANRNELVNNKNYLP